MNALPYVVHLLWVVAVSCGACCGLLLSWALYRGRDREVEPVEVPAGPVVPPLAERRAYLVAVPSAFEGRYMLVSAGAFPDDVKRAQEYARTTRGVVIEARIVAAYDVPIGTPYGG